MASLARLRFPLCVLALAVCAAVQAEPDEEALGKSRGYPVAPGMAQFANPAMRVGTWSAPAAQSPPDYRKRLVAAPAQAAPLIASAQPPAISYRLRNIGYTLDDYLERQRVTGLLLMKNGEVIAERYRYGRTPQARFISFSMSKSVTSMLVGIAADRGLIASLDDPAQKYVKALEGSPYGATTVRQLLRMSSGLVFSERYDGTDDIARLSRAVQGGAPLDVLRGITARHSPAGEKFTYASAETLVLGYVLSAATGRTVADLTAEWLWKPIGAEGDAYWRAAQDGQEVTHGGFHAGLRDWARLGRMLAEDGMANGVQVVPRDYLLDATDPARQPPAFQPRRATPYMGYGYQFWLLPMKARTFAMQGIYGQTVYVQPSSGIVMVQTAVYPQASGQQDATPYQERDAFWRGVLQSLGGSVD